MVVMDALAIDLFCGLGGWTEGLLAEGYRVVGFDIERHHYGNHRYPAQLVLQDVLTIHGSQFKDAALIVASPPCQAYSYRAMPWKRAKALPPPDNSLFEACFRIQREAIEAAGHHIPLVVENVCGAQKWVGRAKWHHGSFYLWGDVPALMPVVRRGQIMKRGVTHREGTGETNFHGSAARAAGVKIPGQDRNRFARTGETTANWRMEAVKVPSEAGRRIDPGKGARFTSRDCGDEAIKCGGDWLGPGENSSAMRHQSSRSSKRKQASAMIAKIPPALARHIAATYYPRG